MIYVGIGTEFIKVSDERDCMPPDIRSFSEFTNAHEAGLYVSGANQAMSWGTAIDVDDLEPDDRHAVMGHFPECRRNHPDTFCGHTREPACIAARAKKAESEYERIGVWPGWKAKEV